jgi:hypothetical protein
MQIFYHIGTKALIVFSLLILPFAFLLLTSILRPLHARPEQA